MTIKNSDALLREEPEVDQRRVLILPTSADPKRWVTMDVPVPMTGVEFDQLTTVLESMRDGLVAL